MAMADDSAEFTFLSAIRGFHVYRQVWTPHLGQRLSGCREHGNVEDRFAVAVIERGGTDIVGHLPREMSRVLWYFLVHGGVINCEVTERRQRSPLRR